MAIGLQTRHGSHYHFDAVAIASNMIGTYTGETIEDDRELHLPQPRATQHTATEHTHQTVGEQSLARSEPLADIAHLQAEKQHQTALDHTLAHHRQHATRQHAQHTDTAQLLDDLIKQSSHFLWQLRDGEMEGLETLGMAVAATGPKASAKDLVFPKVGAHGGFKGWEDIPVSDSHHSHSSFWSETEYTGEQLESYVLNSPDGTVFHALEAAAVGGAALLAKTGVLAKAGALVKGSLFGGKFAAGVFNLKIKNSVQILEHSKISFSQTSVNNVEEITESMKLHGWLYDPVDIVKLSDGTLVTLDNTRVLAASRANILVNAIVHEVSEKLTPEYAERFTTKKGGVPETWGEAVLNRINKQSNIYRTLYSNGSKIIGASN